MDVDPGINSTTVKPFIVEQNKTFLTLYLITRVLGKFYSNCLRWWLLCHCAEAPASFAYQCTSAVVYIAAYSELQSNGVNDGGTTESRGLHG